jgi:hypothetical protein
MGSLQMEIMKSSAAIPKRSRKYLKATGAYVLHTQINIDQNLSCHTYKPVLPSQSRNFRHGKILISQQQKINKIHTTRILLKYRYGTLFLVFNFV